MPKITEYDSLTTPNNNDLLVIEDTVASNTKNITREAFLTGTPLPADTVDTQSIQDEAITNTKIDTNTITQDRFSSSAGEINASWVSYTPTLTGFTGTPTINYAKYKKIGTQVTISMYVSGTSNSTAKTFSIPFPSSSSSAATSMSINQHTSANPIGFVTILESANIGQVYGGFASGVGNSGFSNWPTSGSMYYRFTITYETA